eukprot:CAMPEP_0185401638 /NCGR_PEP_ID=MMETSP1364-20130426/91395_1 /TAXON_ID=38817 /ORGANISM="Gephyrocapsa oceanica, Strain RCC1303" /LENGTH=93 /DNA_ID=CAMNT_0028003935 /DNA_START=562 /DNA_END=841 /DNA_ORIENTATION=-
MRAATERVVDERVVLDPRVVLAGRPQRARPSPRLGVVGEPLRLRLRVVKRDRLGTLCEVRARKTKARHAKGPDHVAPQRSHPAKQMRLERRDL